MTLCVCLCCSLQALTIAEAWVPLATVMVVSLLKPILPAEVGVGVGAGAGAGVGVDVGVDVGVGVDVPAVA
jgi:hypothetical protein